MNYSNILDYYSGGIEKDRLSSSLFSLEGIRTKEIIGRHIPVQAVKVIDIGGGAGYYSFWLNELGHRVSMIDLSPDNIAIATRYANDNQVRIFYHRLFSSSRRTERRNKRQRPA